MTTVVVGQRPYRPNFIHGFYAWIDRLPLPSWLFFVLLVPLIAIAQHLVAWSRGMLVVGQFNYDLAYAGTYLAGTFLILLYVLRSATKALDQFRPLLHITQEEYARLRYEFVTIPGTWGTVFFLTGVGTGALGGFSDMAVAPPVDYAFPLMRIGAIWMFGSGVFMLLAYFIVRQLRQIGAFYAMPERLDLFNTSPLYGLSRYTATLGIIIFLVSALGAFLDPTAYESEVVLISGVGSIIPFVLLMFFLPLAGAHRRLVSEKERLLQEVNSRIETILERIDLAAFEEQDYGDVAGMRTVFSTMREKKETIEGLSTWPWRPGTLTGLLSALFLPIVLVFVREVISRLLSS